MLLVPYVIVGVLVREGNVQIETKHVLTPIQPQWFEQVDKYSAGYR